jgi:hypothetical protein
MVTWVGTLATLHLILASWIQPLPEPDVRKARGWIEAMSQNPKGPFDGIAWYCADGSLLPPEPFACEAHGGGHQYGYYSGRANKLAKMGIYVATIITALKSEDFVANHFYRLRAMVVESYLERALDGWTLRAAKSYRGIRQIQDEQSSAETILTALASDPRIFNKKRALFLRVMRAMPYGREQALGDRIRALAGQLGDTDSTFASLRYKIHSLPEASDIQSVKSYLTKALPEHKKLGERLLTDLNKFYDPSSRFLRLRWVAKHLESPIPKNLLKQFMSTEHKDLMSRLVAGFKAISACSRHLGTLTEGVKPAQNLLLLHAMGLVEEILVSTAAELVDAPMPRSEAVALAASFAHTARDLGYLSTRELRALEQRLGKRAWEMFESYQHLSEALAQILDWGRARIVADLHLPLMRYSQIEPRSIEVIDDILRGGLILPLAVLVDRFQGDLQKISGRVHEVRGLDDISATKLKAENGGAAKGPLRILRIGQDPHILARHDIALLYELPADLPPVAGILTVGSAGSLSHVSLLARNLGIPHASIGEDIAQALENVVGQELLLGVTRGGHVSVGQLSHYPSDTVDLFTKPALNSTPFLTIAHQKLDLKTTLPLLLSDISEKDSGVKVGPKAAELGRLKKLFPDRVSDAVVLPFGIFVAHVSQSKDGKSPSPLDVLREAYEKSAALNQDQAESYLLTQLAIFRDAILKQNFVPGFTKSIAHALKSLGRPGEFGVFVRSDTNVEDLKNFTGAGLNKTIAHRTQLKSILKAIKEVWASPYSERSFRWRQRILTNPEHVFPSVLLHKTIPSEMSGVMVTTDLWGNEPGALTVSVGEGVAAVVDGGAPETVVLHRDGKYRLISSSRSSTRKAIPRAPAQGVLKLVSEEIEPLLGEPEFKEIRQVAQEVFERIPARDGLPWDIEFGFLKGKLYLMQIRPLQTSLEIATHPWLKALDRASSEQEIIFDPCGALP